MTEQEVLDMLAAGRQLDVILQKSSWLKWDVTELAREYGYEFDPQGCPSKATRKATRRVKPKPSGFGLMS